MASNNSTDDTTAEGTRGSATYDDRLTAALTDTDSPADRLDALTDIVADILATTDVDDRYAYVEDLIQQDVIGTGSASAVDIDVVLNDLRWFTHSDDVLPAAADGDGDPLAALELRHPPSSHTPREALYDLVGQLYTAAICRRLDARKDDDAIRNAVYEAMYEQVRDPRVLMHQEFCRLNDRAIGPKEVVTTESTRRDLTWTTDDADEIAWTLIQASIEPEANLDRFPTTVSEWDHPSADTIQRIVDRVDDRNTDTASESPAIEQPTPDVPPSLGAARFDVFVTAALNTFDDQIDTASGSALDLAETAAEQTLQDHCHDTRDEWITAIADGVQHRLNIGSRDGTPVYLADWSASLTQTDDGELVIAGEDCPVCGHCVVNTMVMFGGQFVGSPTAADYDYHLDDGGWNPEIVSAKCGGCQTELVTDA